jgi:hypothetical protein
MDWIFLSALAGVLLVCLAISYDIACQWQIHLRERAKKIVEGARARAEAAKVAEAEEFSGDSAPISTNIPTSPSPITTKFDDFEIQFALPVWHAIAHEVTCQTQNSLSYAFRVGRTDGKEIERTWSILNPVGFATKEMGDRARHDAIENKVDHVNFEKNIGQGTDSGWLKEIGSLTKATGKTLARKLIVAIAERDKEVQAFKDVDRTLERELRGDWKKRVDDWVADRSKPNPYFLEGGKSGE